MNERKENRSVGKVAASDKWTDTIVARPSRYGEPPLPFALVKHSRKNIGPEAAFAMHCIERWAMVAAEQDGEDSAGRTRLRRMTPDEIVSHACDCADKAFAAFQERGWLVDVPDTQSLLDMIKDHENTNE